MKRNRKMLVIGAAGLVVALALVLCFAFGVFHIHAAKDVWAGNSTSHWHQCRCGELIDMGEHRLENGLCSVCGSVVEELPEGGCRVTAYNEKGDPVRIFLYAANGNQISEEQVEYTYRGGEITGKKRYQNGLALAEYEYAKKTDGASYVVKETLFNADGTVSGIREFDENGQLLVDSLQTEDGTGSSKRSEYDGEAARRTEKEYSGEELIAEYEYLQAEDGTEVLVKSTVWFEEGDYVVTEYSDAGEELSTVYYDANGNVIEE